MKEQVESKIWALEQEKHYLENRLNFTRKQLLENKELLRLLNDDFVCKALESERDYFLDCDPRQLIASDEYVSIYGYPREVIQSYLLLKRTKEAKE